MIKSYTHFGICRIYASSTAELSATAATPTNYEYKLNKGNS